MHGALKLNTSLCFLEDKNVLNVVLMKSQRKASECWKSLLADDYIVDPFTFMEMEKKLTLERFQSEVKALGSVVLS